MNKEELIALSDLNREDNIKYISSEAQGIAITLNSDKYAPTLCKLERAYICGRRKSEEKIAELEEKNRELRDRLCNVANNLLDSWCRNEEDYCPHLAKLEKENLELKRDKEQLTEAKKIIKEFVEWANWQGSGCPSFKSRLDKAEQFLSEVEK